ncbi:hypothetical protein ACX6XY_11475 [Streptomyces sp. O3]
MNAPAVRRQRAAAVPAPELVTLLVDPDGPYADSPPGWWDPYEGALDVISGVVYLPQRATPRPCPFPCTVCAERRRQ